MPLRSIGKTPFFVLIVAMASIARPHERPTHAAEPEQIAREILDASELHGGVVVHVGCGDGRLTAALWADARYVVHGLDSDAEQIDRARQYLQSRGLYGKVSVRQWTGPSLPYAENLVNLLVVEDDTAVAMDEMLRVLRPGGIAYVADGGEWTKTVKPWPSEIDEWTHWQHGPDGNAVAQDHLVGPPRRWQWGAGPAWSRHHDTVPSVSAMVSSAGRLFYIVDEAPTGVVGTAPDKWALVARDAFNGVEQWRIPIVADEWGWNAWSAYSVGRFNQPNQVPKRLVAVGDRVYVTLGFNAPLTAVDAATGQIVKTYPGTEYTDEILYLDDTLIVSTSEAPQKAAPIAENPPVKKTVRAIDSDSGRLLWKSDLYTGISTKTDPLERVTHLMLAARGGHVYLVDGGSIVAIDRTSGREVWKADRPEVKRYTSRYAHLMSDMATMVVTDEVVLFCQLEPVQQRIGWRVIRARLQAYSTATGKRLWNHPCGSWAHFSVPDLFVAQGLAWVHDKQTMSMVGYDPLTGAEKRRISTDPAFDNGHHHRCYRAKATERFFVGSFRGLEFIDWKTDTTDLNHWVRGTCRYGVMPANGMIYASPSPCDCYLTSKLNGLLALTPGANVEAEQITDGGRLQRGTAFDEAIATSAGESSNANDWPTYRHDPGRSGGTRAVVPHELKLLWSARLPGTPSAPTVADGRVFAASVDTHAIHAIDAETGRVLWQFTADGPVDTPPTIDRGRVLFGDRRGVVYCLRVNDGKLVWRFLAATSERLVGAMDDLESAWPVHGSMLVQDGAIFVAAGRSSFLDGGIRAWKLDPATGSVLASEEVKTSHEMKVAWGRNHKLDTGTIADILMGDGQRVFMRQRRLFNDRPDEDAPPLGHLQSTAGMLEGSWFNRSMWILDGRAQGQYLVHDEETVYAVRKYNRGTPHEFFTPAEAGYQLVAVDREPAPPRKPDEFRPDINNDWKRPQGNKWSIRLPLRITSMAVTADALFTAGTPDVIDPIAPWASHEGKRTGQLTVVSTTDGKVLAQYELQRAPVLDGLAITTGHLFISTRDGQILCYGSPY